MDLKDLVINRMNEQKIEELRINPYNELKTLLRKPITDKRLEEMKILKEKLNEDWTEHGVDLWTTSDLLIDAIEWKKKQSNGRKRTVVDSLPKHITDAFIDKFVEMIENYRRKNNKNNTVEFGGFLKKLKLTESNFPDFVRQVRGRFMYETFENEGKRYIELIPFGSSSNRVTVREVK